MGFGGCRWHPNGRLPEAAENPLDRQLQTAAASNPIDPNEKLSSSPNLPNELSAPQAMTAVFTAPATTPDPVLSSQQDRRQHPGDDDSDPGFGPFPAPTRPRPPRPRNPSSSFVSNKLRRKSQGAEPVHVTDYKVSNTAIRDHPCEPKTRQNMAITVRVLFVFLWLCGFGTAAESSAETPSKFGLLKELFGDWYRWRDTTEENPIEAPSRAVSLYKWSFYKVTEKVVIMLTKGVYKGGRGDFAVFEEIDGVISMQYFIKNGSDYRAQPVWYMDIDESCSNSTVWKTKSGDQMRILITGNDDSKMAHWQTRDTKTGNWIESGIPFRRDSFHMKQRATHSGGSSNL